MGELGKLKNISGDNIRKARLKLDMRQEDVVAALSVDFGIEMDRSALGRIERGDRGIYDYELKALAKILKASVSELVKK